MTPTLAVRCPRCGRRYQCDRRRIGYSILCATAGCQTMIDVKPPVSPWLIASVLGIGAATAVAYSYGRSSNGQVPAQAVQTLPSSGAASIPPKASLPTVRPTHKRLTDLSGTNNGLSVAVRQTRRQEAHAGGPSALYIPTQIEVHQADRSGTHLSSQHSQAKSQIDLETPTATEPQAGDISLPTGMDVVQPRDPGGMGELTVINGTGQDAVVKLSAPVSEGGPLLSYHTVFIKAHDRWTIRRIGEGRYTLFFALGEDWDQSAHRFRSNDSYSQFEDPLTFQQKTTQSSTETGYRTGTRYSTFTVTLNSVLNGNSRVADTDKTTFNALN